ncbi:MAG: fumarylacetoacetase [Pseudomonadota bacterium]
MKNLNETHDPQLRSWVDGSAPGSTDFPIQNLPFGRFRTSADGRPRIGVAIGSQILDLALAHGGGLLGALSPAMAAACRAQWLNPLMGMPAVEVSALRLALSRLLRVGSVQQMAAAACLVEADAVELLLAADVRSFSDFYTSIHHARTTGSMSRPANPLLPNFQHLPPAYHGRASTLRVSGTPLVRPHGEQLPAGAAVPVFGPTQKMDFECELAIHVGAGNALGEQIPLRHAPASIFGVGLLNDWSARDVQAWEAQPLGPFLGKSALTSVSPWIVTLEALAPYRVPAAPREAGAPALLPHLDDVDDRTSGGLDIALEVWLQTDERRARGEGPALLSRPRFKDQYWTVAQMLTHQTSNGCQAEPGDILGSGTVSGPVDAERGCLLEITRGGTRTIELAGGDRRTWLEDGDEVSFKARCTAEGAVAIGFGECTGRVTPAV